MSLNEIVNNIDICKNPLARCLRDLINRVTALEQREQQETDIFRSCGYNIVDRFSFLQSLLPDERVQWVLEYFAVQPSPGGPWIQLSSGPIASPQYGAADFTEAYPGSGITQQYVDWMNGAISGIGAFYDFAASASLTLNPFVNTAPILIRSNISVANYVIAFARDTINLTLPTTRRTYYTYTLDEFIIPGATPPYTRAWTIGDSNVLPVAPYPPITITTDLPNQPTFWTNFSSAPVNPVALNGIVFDENTNYISGPCGITIPDPQPLLLSMPSRTRLLLQAKPNLEPTPYDEKQKYPITAAEDINHDSLLYQRLQLIKQGLKAIMPVKNTELLEFYLFGSQLKGKSHSGSPDIDITVWHPDFENNISLRAACKNVLNKFIPSLPFKVDALIARQNIRV